jgi:hypothetical protein
MKKFTICLIVLASTIIACKKADESPYCQRDEPLGDFTPTLSFPYTTSVRKSLQNTMVSIPGVLEINAPAQLQNNPIELSKSVNETYDCLKYYSEVRYNWSRTIKQALVTIIKSGKTTHILLKQQELIDETNPKLGSIGTATELYIQNTSTGQFLTKPFMRLMTSPKQVLKCDSLQLDWVKLDTITINGTFYQSIYKNGGPLVGEVSNTYYSLQKGLVAIKDKNGLIWEVK